MVEKNIFEPLSRNIGLVDRAEIFFGCSSTHYLEAILDLGRNLD